MVSRLPAADHARGLIIGLLLGDALAYKKSEPTSWLLGSAAGQLTCFALEGLIRAHVRFAHRGVSSPAGTVWHAYHRWAYVQKVVPTPRESSSTPWPDGWLHQQAPLAWRRGDAPSTVRALKTQHGGCPAAPVGQSAGHHALSNAAPVALFAPLLNVQEQAREVAALTHGNAVARQAAADGATLLAAALTAASWRILDLAPRMQHEGPRGTAQGALGVGTAAARDAHELQQFLDAIAAADQTGGRGAATYAGALLGAFHGVEQLPQEHIGRLELGIVDDTLARDAVTQLTDGPSGS